MMKVLLHVIQEQPEEINLLKQQISLIKIEKLKNSN
jgi:hypothetical protein